MESNKQLATSLRRLAKVYETISSDTKWYNKVDILNNAALIVDLETQPITNAEEFGRTHKGIGKSLVEMINDFLNKGGISRLEKIEEINRGKIHVVSMFMKIYGIGRNQALQFYDQGCRNFPDLTTKVVLNDNQKVGLKYYWDFKRKIYRREIEELKLKLSDVFGPLVDWEIVGSFRRKERVCHDIDILISSDDSKILDKIVKELYRLEVLLYTFTQSKSKFMGILNHNPARRIDIFLCSKKEKAASLLMYTGPKHFCRYMSFQAKKKGYSLSRNGLKLGETYVKTETEEDIFQILGMDYIQVEERFKHF